MKLMRWLSTLVLLFVSFNVVAQVPPAQNSVTPQKLPTFSFTKDMTIYVSDFELDAENVQVDKGSAINQVRPGILERPSKKEQRDPEAQAKKLVDTMSKSIVSDLQKAGYKAQRLAADDPKPSTGAWVHGVFTQVDEGSRIHRAIIGFGSGKATMELFVTLTDLASPQKPLYEASEDRASKNRPGAVITLNPYVAAAKFVMEKNAPEKTVKSTAAAISREVTLHLQPNPISSGLPTAANQQ
ncbi:DUF4410 domain-containing protein [Tunturibacter empetritectus]|uniref:DUF4410 domain-containing protein n=1 Tax=Tunturiibacter empetritectus TaxID=3069691 RepID=A0A7W8IIS4_9BACT|nr:DUF4410 domain-containing protein [Edaphobacter lichenicola]MBB5317941.1 hypothetical protein [Edaphobacter lichenicola]